MLRLATGDPQSHRSRPIRPSRRARNERCCMHPLEWPRRVAIAGLLMLRPRAGGGSDPVSTKMSAAQRTTAAGAPVVTAPATRTGSTATGAAAMVGATRADSLRSASATPAPTAPVVQPEQRAPESAPPELRAAPRRGSPGPINIRHAIPSMPAAPNVDSIVRSATERQRASDTDRTGTGDESLTSRVGGRR